jgi:D-serine deaminase-like pyridoxal phosphate-dependent protein
MTAPAPFATPTLVLDEARARRNIARRAGRARRLGVRFRPHFKTHQSRRVGRIFREFGVEAVTVSSVEMAEYFAADGWRDILIAFPVNIREAEAIARLARRCHLGLLAESPDVLAKLDRTIANPVDLWIKVDVGCRRAGIDWNDADRLARTCRAAARRPRFRLRGLLTHNGRTYAARTLEALARSHADAMGKMRRARNMLAAAGFPSLEISVGDTPACSRLDDFAGADEIRPGNFVLYDAMQLELGSCRERDIAAAVACPVVAVHPSRNEILLYGGAIHLSKDSFLTAEDVTSYGRVCRPRGRGWGPVLPETSVVRLSQEHAVVETTAREAARTRPGDVLFVLPAHSCLTVDLFDEYVSLDGRRIPTIHGGRPGRSPRRSSHGP